MNFAIDYLIQLFTGLFDFFDRIFIQTGYIVWVGSAFLMFLSYRFLILPVFGSFNISNFSDSVNQYQRAQSARARDEKKLREHLWTMEQNNPSKRG